LFVEKLNKKQEGFYVIEEEKDIQDGKWEGYLEHDNANRESLVIYTGPNFTGERVNNFFISTPSETPWKTHLKVFSNSEKIYVTYESQGDQVEAEDINQVQNVLADTVEDLNDYKAATDASINDLEIRTTNLEETRASKTYVDTELNKVYKKEEVFNKEEVIQRIQDIIGAAPEALDTLEEIALALNEDPDFAATITNLLAQKVDKVPGKGLSTEDFTTAEKQKLAGIEDGANKYIHPSTHPASMIVETSEKRFVNDIEKATWNAKETPEGAQTKADQAEQNAKAYADIVANTAETNAKNYADNKIDDLAGVGRTTETVKEVADDLVSHKANTANPHNVTKSQIGLANVDNVKQASKTEFDSHNNDTTRHITAEERTRWNNKAEVSQIPTKVSQLENDRGYVTQEELGDAGYGDMMKSVYDTNGDGIVDNADKLDGKHASDFALASHTHTVDAITGELETTKLTEPPYVMGNVTITSKPLFDILRADRTAFLPASQIIIEKSIDGGVTWEDAGISDTNKAKLFSGQRPSITIPLKDGMKNTDCMLRITITGMKYNVPPGTVETAKYNYWNSSYVIARERYFLAEDAWLWVSSHADRIYCKVERATGANPNNWTTVREAFLAGWAGGNYIKLGGANFGGGTSQTSNYWNWRFTFRTATTSNDFDNAKLSQTYITQAQTIYHIKISGKDVWASSNSLMYHDHLYAWDENQNVTFPANVTASDFYAGSNKVWHAGNFDPNTKLNKGPLTWNDLKGV